MDKKFVICPFNKTHVISRLRIQYHLVKCKKNYPHCKKIVCPYNATEYINPDNFLQHLSECKKSRGLDVTEEYKRKQFESGQHGCVNNQSFQMPPHVEVTDEWDIASSDSSNSTITRDERNAIRLRRQSSDAIRKSYSHIPLVLNSIGRGKVNEAMRQYLNRYEPFEKSVDKFASIHLADDINDGSHDDCDNSDASINYDDNIHDEIDGKCDVSSDSNMYNSERKLPNDSNYDDNDNEVIVSNCIPKYYMPSVGRGCSVTSSGRGRGIPVSSLGRGITFNSNNTISSVSGSFDDFLKEVVDTLFHKELLSDNRCKENTTSEIFDGEKKDAVSNNLYLENAKKFALLPSDILPKNSHLLKKESISEQMSSQPTTSCALSSAKFPLNCSSKVNNNIVHNSELSSYSIDSVPDEYKTVIKEETIANSEPEDLEDASDILTNMSSPKPYCTSIGRGQLLRSLDSY